MPDRTAYFAQRAAITLTCRDTDAIPKGADAGRIVTEPDGTRVQIMHNGVRVVADGYYDPGLSNIIAALHGHHEPQEEKVFHEVLRVIRPGGVMIELGAYWSYYSLWFRQAVPDARNIMVEPVAENIDVGRRNFALNRAEGVFLQALVGDRERTDLTPPMVCVDGLMARYGLDEIEMLHADIQKHEYAMLQGARRAFGERRVRFAFISTHGGLIHSRCLGFLRRRGYRILAEHTRYESFSADGLIVATRERDHLPVPISHRRGAKIALKSFVYRLLSHLFS
jgi:hypothetical protein